MNNAGIVHSESNRWLCTDKKLSEVSYLELVQVVDPKSNDDEFCQSNNGLCDLYSNCNIIKPIDKLNATLNGYLKNLTIDKLFNMAFASDGENKEQFHV